MKDIEYDEAKGGLDALKRRVQSETTKKNKYKAKCQQLLAFYRNACKPIQQVDHNDPPPLTLE